MFTHQKKFSFSQQEDGTFTYSFHLNDPLFSLFSLFYYGIENIYSPSHNLLDKVNSQEIWVWISWPGGTEVQSSLSWMHALYSDLLYIRSDIPSDIPQKKAAAMFKSCPNWCVWHTLITLIRSVSGETDNDIPKLWTLTRHETKLRCLILLNQSISVHFQTRLCWKWCN